MGLGRKATGFLLVVGSGLATTLGAGVVLSPKLASLSNTKFLGAALAVSCGVMLYVLLPSSLFLTISQKIPTVAVHFRHRLAKSSCLAVEWERYHARCMS